MFKFYMSTEIIAGENVLNQIGKNAKKFGRKAIIITDKGIIAAGLPEIIIDSLKSTGMDYIIYDKTVENPTVDNVLEATRLCLENNCDIIIAVGGGSPIDCAKGVSVMAVNEGSPYDYNAAGGKTFSKTLPLLAIPTTCGTGSEVSGGSVITIPDKKLKFVIAAPSLFPRQAYLDPRMVENLSCNLVAATGMDAITHLIEAYTSRNANVFSDGLSLQGLKIAGKYLRTAVAGDLYSRTQMMYASSMGAMSFMQAGLGLVHALAVTMGGMYGTHHGLANAILLPCVMEFNRISQEDKFCEIAKALGEKNEDLSKRDAAFRAIKAVRDLNSDIGIPAKLKTIGIKEEDIPEMSKKALEHPDGIPNKRLYNLKDIENIYKKAF